MPLSFPARYSSRCNPCDEEIKPGEFILMHPDAGAVHEECFDDVNQPVQSNGAAFDSFNRGRPPIPVLPRGKTSKDRCNKCFQVPASNGECGCF